MSNKDKHIDRIFQESFKEFEAKPSDDVWRNIQLQLQPKKKRLFPIWWKTAGIAAALVVAFGLGYFLQPKNELLSPFITNSSNENNMPKVEESWSSKFSKANLLFNNLASNALLSSFNAPLINQLYTTKNINLSNPNNAEDALLSFKKEDTKNTELKAKVANLKENANGNQTKINPTHFLSNFLFSNFFTEDNTDLIANQTELSTLNEKEKHQFDVFYENDVATEKLTEKQNWFLKPVISPIFNAGSNASASLGQEVANNSSSGDLSFSYGLQVGIKLSNKWSVRSGINQINTSYTTNDVVYSPSAIGFMPEGVNAVYGLYSANFYDTNLSTESGRLFSQQGSLSQQLNFLEIPLEMEYALVQGKFGVHLTGGASTLLLTGNSLVLNTVVGSEKIGEANNLNRTSFSTNVGIGVHYQLTNKLKLNVEPALKYQINTFQGSDLSFNPYFFGVYSGLQFQF